VEELCHQLRNLPILKKWAEKANIRLLCAGREKNGPTRTVVVSVVSILKLIITFGSKSSAKNDCYLVWFFASRVKRRVCLVFLVLICFCYLTCL